MATARTETQSLTARHAWRGALVASALNAAGMPLDILIARHIEHVQAWPALVSSALGLVLFVVLLSRRRSKSLRLARVAFLLNSASVVSAVWMSSGEYVASGRVGSPFQADKLGLLVVALLAPDLPVGLVCLAAYTTAPIVRYALLEPEVRALLHPGEPWVIVAYTLVAITLLAYRVRGLDMELKAVRAQSDAAALDRLAHTMLAVRDLANTPLQTIELNVALIRQEETDPGPPLVRIQQALHRLHELNHILTRHESRLRWDPGDESFPAKSVLERELISSDEPPSPERAKTR